MPQEEAIGHILETFQRIEITEYHIYKRLAKSIKNPENRLIMEQIAEDELRHSEDWKKYTQQDIKPNMWDVWKYFLISRIFGFTFGIKLMERGEERAQENYGQLKGKIPNIEKWIHEEEVHEQKLLAMLDEERLRYAGSVVLGLNDALVELTGALAGLTLALQNVKLIALSGLITGIAASLSMAASEYLSTRSEETDKHPVRAAVYTGIAYIITVTLLVLPYLLIQNYIVDLVITLLVAVLIIAAFNYYISVAKDEPFRSRFLEMAGLSLGVAAFSFIIGFFIRQWLGVDV
ncbi:MAG: VIT1/CCC1 transporter family protein [Anaerolineales bacterium]|jgi:vacuolar iron transporter family protein